MTLEWDRKDFGYWLRLKRRVEQPMSQERLAELTGVTQAKISRWELNTDNTEPPTLDECLALADVFNADFIDLATLCGRWNNQLAEHVLRGYNVDNWRDHLRSRSVRPVALSRVIATAKELEATAEGAAA